MRDILRNRLCSSTGAALVLLALGCAGRPTAALAIDAAPAPSAVLEPAATAATELKPLPASHDELVFRGENASRRWSVALSRTEASRVSSFQFGLLNTISLLPDRSTLKLTINGRVLTTTALRSADKVGLVQVRIPTGLLVPGFNQVQVDVAQAHRVDCSVAATYELWSMLDGSQTGFVVPRDASGSVRSLEEIAAEPLAADGTTRIHLRMPAEAGAPDLDRATRLVSALVTRAKLARPVIDVGAEAGTGPGIDIVVATAGTLNGLATDRVRVLGRDGDVVLVRDVETNRLGLVLSGQNEGDLDAAVDRFEALPPAQMLGTPAALRTLDQQDGTAINGATRLSFGALGFADLAFTGRHLESALRVKLPDDFYAGNYDKARLYIDGTRSGALLPGSVLSFWVNGQLVSSVDLSSAADSFAQEQFELPLRFFHPGSNDIVIKATTLTAADKQCEMRTGSEPPRLTLSSSSELEFPGVAHLGTLMHVQRSLRFDAATPLEIYVPRRDASALGAGLTFAANVAKASGRTGPVRFHLEDPHEGGVPGIVVASRDALPDFLERGIADVVAARPETTAEAGEAATTDPIGSAARANSAALAGKVGSWLGSAEGWFSNQGFFFRSASGPQKLALPADAALVVAAVNPEPGTRTVAGVALPQVSRDGRQWLVVTTPQPDMLEPGVRTLVSSGIWPTMSGRAVGLDLRSDAVQSVEAVQPPYVLPRSFALSDVRPVLGGVVSNNIELSAALLVTLISLLGISAHALLRSAGTRPR